MIWGKEYWGRRPLWSDENAGVREERETATGSLLQRWGWDPETGSGGAGGQVWICCQPICCPGRSGPWISRVCLLQVGTGTKQQVEVKEIWRSVGFTGDGTREQGRLPQMLYSRVGDETVDLYPGKSSPSDAFKSYMDTRENSGMSQYTKCSHFLSLCSGNFCMLHVSKMNNRELVYLLRTMRQDEKK